MKAEVNDFGVVYFDFGNGEYLLKLYIDSETELTMSLVNSKIADVQKIQPSDFFNTSSTTN